MSGASKLCELLKALRSEWLPISAIAEDIGVDEGTARTWVRELAEQGLLVMRRGVKSARLGRASTAYSLAPEWGGSAT
jgi:predicted ArsR family transcriptional regulator